MIFGDESKEQSLLTIKKVREDMEAFNSYFWPTDFLIGNRRTFQIEQLKLLPVFSSLVILLP